MEKIENILYVVATPIGNLDEMTPRALHVLSNVDMIACEDTRNSIRLLTHFNISKPLIALHKFNEASQSENLTLEIKNGKKLAVISDAGYPAISDPGGLLIKKCIEEDIIVRVVSGSCAYLNALVGSGIDSSHFYFHGFLSMRNKERKMELTSLAKREETTIIYEAPHHLLKTLEELMKYYGEDRFVAICRELTKLHEEYYRGSLKDVYEHYLANEVKGEIVIILEGNKNLEVETINIDPLMINEEIDRLRESGYSSKDAIKAICEKYNMPKNEVYNLYHK